MSCLPLAGRVACAACHPGETARFNETVTAAGDWRLLANPLAWGSHQAEVVVLGFSKGPNQKAAIATQPHDRIAFAGGRKNLAKILHHVGLIPTDDTAEVDRAIAAPNGRFHFASLVRCTVERFDAGKGEWTGTSGNMLDRFFETSFGQAIAGRCARTHLGALPDRTRLVLMLGMGGKGRYVENCRRLFQAARGGAWRRVNEVAYTDGKITVVHTEHFKSQGALLPDWLSGDAAPRGRLGLLARDAVQAALA